MTQHQAKIALDALRESRDGMLAAGVELATLRSLFAVDRDNTIRAICAENDLNHIAHVYLNVPRERALVRVEYVPIIEYWRREGNEWVLYRTQRVQEKSSAARSGRIRAGRSSS